MSTPLTLETARHDDGKVVLIRCRRNRPEQRRRIQTRPHSRQYRISRQWRNPDCRSQRVEYLDSAAINALFARAEPINVIAHPLLMSIFTISGLSELATVEPASSTAEQ